MLIFWLDSQLCSAHGELVMIRVTSYFSLVVTSKLFAYEIYFLKFLSIKALLYCLNGLDKFIYPDQWHVFLVATYFGPMVYPARSLVITLVLGLWSVFKDLLDSSLVFLKFCTKSVVNKVKKWHWWNFEKNHHTGSRGI